uniref:Uncharacterized protein n=1 Tax=Romanomermis culicivorax TaxID=13658 RepID=A0A915K357_ROMCU
MGPESWLDGLHNASQKIRDLDTANRLLAHRPWLLQLSHLKSLASAPNNWSICEMVQGALILSHTHALCSFVNGCGIKAACDPETTTIPKRVLSPSNHHHSENGDNLSRDLSVVSQGNDNVHRSAENSISRASGAIKNSPNGQRRSLTSVKTESSPTNKGVDSLPIINRVASISADSSFTSSSTSFIKRAGAVLTKCKSFSSCVENRNEKMDNGTTDDDNVEKLVACLQVLNEAGVAERSQEDKLKLFIDVNSQNFELFDIVKEVEEQRHLNSKDHPFSLFTEEPNFTYTDFFKKADGVTTPTFTIHEYSWGDQGYSVVSELYCEISNVIDDKFRVIQDLTYHTMGGHKNVDTTKYRTAIWNYIQSLFGIRHDDYDYSEINKLLSRTMKSYIKILCCCPERMKDSLRNNVMIDFLMSEKIHVNLMIFEARFQAEILYFLRTVLRLLT